MKKIFYLLLCLWSVFACYAQEKKGGAIFEPTFVIEGNKKQTVVYNPYGTVLENETNIKAVIYFWGTDFAWKAHDLSLTQKEGKWIGTFSVPKEASLLTCKFYSGDKTDFGWPATYTSFVLDKKQRNKPAANIGWALLRSDETKSIPGLLADSAAAPISGEVVMMWFNNELRQFPERHPKTMGLLVKTLNRYKQGERNDLLKQNIEGFLNDRKLKLSDQEWVDLYEIAKFTLTDQDLAARIEKREMETYPDGILSRDKEVWRISQLFVKEQDKAQADFVKFMKRFPTGKFLNAHSQNTELFYSKIFRSVIYDRIMRADDYSNLKKYIHDIPYDELVTTHWHIVEVCFNNGQVTPEKLLPYSELIINEMMTRPQTTYAQQLYSPLEWEIRKIEMYNMALFAHARILGALGRTDEAYEYAQLVYPFYSHKPGDFNEFYTNLLFKKGLEKEMIAFIKESIHVNIINEQMLNLLKADYVKQHDASGFENYVESLKNQDQKEKERIKALKNLMNESISLCELEQLNGMRVNLADKKGKIMFLDFWATWCGPCKASMPGGQMIVDRYKEDPNVEFYFVDCCEISKDYKKKVEEFIAQKGYTFNVLFDEGEVGQQEKLYKECCKILHTSGIPLKIIVDGNGNLRWASGGYHGSPSAMADEIEYVIEYLKKERDQ